MIQQKRREKTSKSEAYLHVESCHVLRKCSAERKRLPPRVVRNTRYSARRRRLPSATSSGLSTAQKKELNAASCCVSRTDVIKQNTETSDEHGEKDDETLGVDTVPSLRSSFRVDRR